jgi:polyisoprenoid-binding protein YceI
MQNKSKILFILLLLVIQVTFGQKFITKTGKIRFFSDAQLEKIEAANNSVNAALDVASGEMVFKILIKSFEFEKALMQEHFNENYIESDKYPNSTFKGKISNLKDIKFKKEGNYNAAIEGDLTIHGITKAIKVNGTFEVKNGKITGNSKFIVAPKDYNIKIPTTVVSNIAEKIDVTVDVIFEAITK